MKFILLSILLLSLFLTGCRKDHLAALEGDYKGTFQRQLPGSTALRSNVSLHLSQLRFSGSSDIERYPAICQGSYEVSGKELQIMNSCFYTAEFDWTLIFNGSFQYEIEGTSLKLWKVAPNGTKDLYILEKQ